MNPQEVGLGPHTYCNNRPSLAATHTPVTRLSWQTGEVSPIYVSTFFIFRADTHHVEEGFHRRRVGKWF